MREINFRLVIDAVCMHCQSPVFDNAFVITYDRYYLAKDSGFDTIKHEEMNQRILCKDCYFVEVE